MKPVEILLRATAILLGAVASVVMAWYLTVSGFFFGRGIGVINDGNLRYSFFALACTTGMLSGTPLFAGMWLGAQGWVERSGILAVAVWASWTIASMGIACYLIGSLGM